MKSSFNFFYIPIVIFLSSLNILAQQNFDNLLANQIYNNATLYVDHMINGGSQLAFGAKVSGVLEIGSKGNSGFRIYLSGAVAKNLSKGELGTVLNYQVDLALFTGGIGSSILNSERNRLNIELRNHIGLAIGANDSSKKVWGRPLNSNIGDATSVLQDPLDYSLQLGTAFITGINHKRHQQVGFGKLGLWWFHLFYMNDGPPYGVMALGDTWDRYWTGVGGIGYHRITKYGEITSMELRYSRYTGDEPYLYDLSTNLRMNYLPHKDKRVQFFNKGRYQYRVGFRSGASIGANIYQPKVTDVQRIIHHGVWAFHPNPTERYFSFFGQYSFIRTNLND